MRFPHTAQSNRTSALRVRARGFELSTSRSTASRLQWLAFCAVISAGAVAMSAKVGGLRLADLIVVVVVMSVILWLAVRDALHLSTAIFAVWVFSRLVRRLVDWHDGHFSSLTAISMLPLMATSALLIPTMPRIKEFRRSLIEPLLLVIIPIGAASAWGAFRYGLSVIPDAGNWILPFLFLPYFSLKPLTASDQIRVVRSLIVLAVVSAVYGIYQYLYLPPWDSLWLVQSGMTSSMGSAEPTKIRAWGPMGSTGVAGGFWAMIIVLVVADTGWKRIYRVASILLLSLALLTTMVRTGWFIALSGCFFTALLRPRTQAKSSFVLMLGLASVISLALPYLPGSERILTRIDSLTAIDSDNSFLIRVSIAERMLSKIVEQPMGVGIGFKTVKKIAGNTSGIAGIDNGLGEVFWTLGIPGGLSLLAGLILLAVKVRRFAAMKRLQRTHLDQIEMFNSLAIACFISLFCTLVISYVFDDLNGAVLWSLMGIAMNRANTASSTVQGGYVSPTV